MNTFHIEISCELHGSFTTDIRSATAAGAILAASREARSMGMTDCAWRVESASPFQDFEIEVELDDGAEDFVVINHWSEWLAQSAAIDDALARGQSPVSAKVVS